MQVVAILHDTEAPFFKYAWSVHQERIRLALDTKDCVLNK